MTILILAVVGCIILCGLIFLMSIRTVVPTNEVHIVQYNKKRIVYGNDSNDNSKNVYYNWPTFLPILGVKRSVFPLSVFSRKLNEYEAYDTGRLPFILDLAAFFRIDNPLIASHRVASFNELLLQLDSILQGAARSILASKDIEEIMQGRAEFGIAFTKEVEEQLKAWGVTNVKNIELMDIRDTHNSKVISNIMMKKKSFIEMESRVEVANNNKRATSAEIEADKEIALSKQDISKEIGIRQALVDKEINIAKQKSIQDVAQEQKVTKEKELEVERVAQIKLVEIEKDIELVNADKLRQSQIIDADAKLQSKSKEAESIKILADANANSIRVEGEAKAAAEEKMQMAPINAQLTLAKEIGENNDYQQYLITIKQIEANQTIGLKQAEVLREAELKFVINSDSPNNGINKLSDLLSSKGGMNLGAALEGFANTDIGKTILDKVTKE